MSKTVKGRVQAVSNKPEKDYFGICIDDEWYNGPGHLKKNLEEAETKLEVKDNSENFIDIEKIDVIEEASKDASKNQGRDTSDRSKKGGEGSKGSKTSSTFNMSERQASIMANSSVKMAIEHVDSQYNNNPKQHLEEIDELSKGLQNIMKQRLGDNL